MNKLEALRKLMIEEGIAAYLVPHTDEFQSEYTAPYAERLTFMTGFTGSAGFAVIGLDKAAFFTDGRYTLQAQDQVDGNHFARFHIAQTRPEAWTKDNITGPIGYDPWLFTPEQLKRYEGELKPIPGNLVDRIWGEDQPQRPKNKAFVHPLEFAGESHIEKCKRVGGKLAADKALITTADSVAWLLNIRGDDVVYTPLVLGYILLDKDGTYDFFVDLDKIPAAVYAHLNEKGRVISVDEIENHLTQLSSHTIQLDPHTAPSALADMLKNAEVQLIHKPAPCQLPKAIKNPTEIKGMRNAHNRDGLALVKFMTWLNDQPLAGETTEWTASLKLHALRAELDHFYDLSFDTISGYGPHGAVIHYRVTPESSLPIGRDSLYLVDSGGQYFDGTTDVTRTLCFGTPTAEHKDRYTRVLKGHIALANVRFPKGTTGPQLDVLARHALWESGLDYDHGTGHGVGSFLGVHEGPQGISKRPQSTTLEPGMILSNEPGYYKEGDYGIRIENLVVVKDSPRAEDFYEFETITMAPIATNLIDFAMLTDTEKAWIDSYHKQVLETLGPKLDAKTLSWLEEQTHQLKKH